MSDSYCEICELIFDGYTTTIELVHDKEKVFITGHDSCINELFKKMKNIEGLNKKNVKQVLKEINYIHKE